MKKRYYRKRSSAFDPRSTAMLLFGAAALLIIVLIFRLAGENRETVPDEAQNVPAPEWSDAAVTDDDEAPPLPPPPEPTAFERALGKTRSMTDEQLCGQVILVRGDTLEHGELCALLERIHAGGTVLFLDNFKNKTPEEVKSMTADISRALGGQGLICVDEEGGTVVRMSRNSALRQQRFRSPQSLFSEGGMDRIIDDTREKCAFLREYGLNVNFAPVADVVTDPEGFLYPRAFGSDAGRTAEYVAAVVSTMEGSGVGSCLKHFPGYGNSHGDTHGELVTSSVTADSLWSSDLIPFQAGIAAGADAVMLTHTIVSAIDPDRPASVSAASVSLLRNDLGYEGVLITDGLDMDAINIYCGGKDPCVMAVSAGVDLMCTPVDSEKSYNALLTALADGTVTRGRLEEAAARIMIWKNELGLLEL